MASGCGQRSSHRRCLDPAASRPWAGPSVLVATHCDSIKAPGTRPTSSVLPRALCCHVLCLAWRNPEGCLGKAPKKCGFSHRSHKPTLELQSFGRHEHVAVCWILSCFCHALISVY